MVPLLWGSSVLQRFAALVLLTQARFAYSSSPPNFNLGASLEPHATGALHSAATDPAASKAEWSDGFASVNGRSLQQSGAQQPECCMTDAQGGESAFSFTANCLPQLVFDWPNWLSQAGCTPVPAAADRVCCVALHEGRAYYMEDMSRADCLECAGNNVDAQQTVRALTLSVQPQCRLRRVPRSHHDANHYCGGRGRRVRTFSLFTSSALLACVIAPTTPK